MKAIKIVLLVLRHYEGNKNVLMYLLHSYEGNQNVCLYLLHNHEGNKNVFMYLLHNYEGNQNVCMYLLHNHEGNQTVNKITKYQKYQTYIYVCLYNYKENNPIIKKSRKCQQIIFI